MGLGQNWASARQMKDAEILHLINDEHLIGWLHHWPTGTRPIGPDPSEKITGTRLNVFEDIYVERVLANLC